MASTSRSLTTDKSFATPSHRSLLLFGVLALPVLIAIWFVPWFVTQDGPLHLYNVHIAAELAKGKGFFSDFYVARSGLLPYVGAYKLLAGLLAIFPARATDRLMMSLTSIGLAISVFWLRWRVAGWAGLTAIVPLVILIAISKLWLYGLYPFLLGACLFPLTLGLWWQWRDNLKPVNVLILAALFVLNYFFHIISVGFTVLGISILAVATPGTNLKKRWTWTAASIAPVLYLIIQFRSLMQGSGEAGFSWVNLTNDWSLSGWLQYFQMADFLSFSFKTNAGIFLISTDCPFSEESSMQFALLAPSLWAILGIVLLVVATLSGRATKANLLKSQYRGWIIFVLVLLAIALFGPSGIGTGSLLRERVWLLATVALIPILRFDLKNSQTRFALLFLALAFSLQTAFLWHYALISNRIGAAFLESCQHIGNAQRVAVVMADPRTHYLINSMPNLSNQLGMLSDNVIWNNYGPSYYYFPVAFRNQQLDDNSKKIVSLNELFFSSRAQDIATRNPQLWAKEFGKALDETDILVVWGAAPWFDSLNAQLYHPELIFERGELRVFRHK